MDSNTPNRQWNSLRINYRDEISGNKAYSVLSRAPSSQFGSRNTHTHAQKVRERILSRRASRIVFKDNRLCTHYLSSITGVFVLGRRLLSNFEFRNVGYRFSRRCRFNGPDSRRQRHKIFIRRCLHFMCHWAAPAGACHSR